MPGQHDHRADHRLYAAAAQTLQGAADYKYRHRMREHTEREAGGEQQQRGGKRSHYADPVDGVASRDQTGEITQQEGQKARAEQSITVQLRRHARQNGREGKVVEGIQADGQQHAYEQAINGRVLW